MGAQVSIGLDRLMEDFGSTASRTTTAASTARMHERLGAGLILGASLLTARGVPAAGEYELRTSLAMLVLDRLGAGGSFTEFQALNFRDGAVEMGHDGPAHLAISSAGRCCAASASITASAAGACPWSSTCGTGR